MFSVNNHHLNSCETTNDKIVNINLRIQKCKNVIKLIKLFSNHLKKCNNSEIPLGVSSFAFFMNKISVLLFLCWCDGLICKYSYVISGMTLLNYVTVLLFADIKRWAHSCTCSIFIWIRHYIANCACKSCYIPFDKAAGDLIALVSDFEFLNSLYNLPFCI